MSTLKASIIILSLAISPMLFSEETQGFNEICRIYTEAQNSSMKKEQLNDYIHNNIAARVNSNDALSLHSIIFTLSPNERYPIFKESVESSLRHNWDCDAMKALLK